MNGIKLPNGRIIKKVTAKIVCVLVSKKFLATVIEILFETLKG